MSIGKSEVYMNTHPKNNLSSHRTHLGVVRDAYGSNAAVRVSPLVRLGVLEAIQHWVGKSDERCEQAEHRLSYPMQSDIDHHPCSFIT